MTLDRTIGEYLRDFYSGLLGQVRHALTDQTTLDDAPAFAWYEADPAPISPRESLLALAQSHSAGVGVNVLEHVKVLIRAYPTRLCDSVAPEDHHWPGLVSLTLAGGILEGCAQIRWLLDASTSFEERACRLARIALWSEYFAAKLLPPGENPAGLPVSVQDYARRAGMVVKVQ